MIDLEREIEEIRKTLKTHEDYLDQKRRLRDWRGVIEVASEIREFEAALDMLYRDKKRFEVYLSVQKTEPNIAAITSNK